ncbi:MAG TPA: SRPBCC domain-containing protein [Pseudonocardia sp.]|nr:SRPBCC domain-containing protein [Pseudonocardia sp.]
MPTGTADPIIREIDIEAAPETVFEFFVDPAKLTRWLAVEATLDARPGGVCHQVHEGAPGQGPYYMQGEFLEVDPPKRVVFSWGFSSPDVHVPPGTSTVEVTLSPLGTGTRVLLVHRGLPVEAVGDHSGGWTIMLDRLRAAVTGT